MNQNFCKCKDLNARINPQFTKMDEYLTRIPFRLLVQPNVLWNSWTLQESRGWPSHHIREWQGEREGEDCGNWLWCCRLSSTASWSPTPTPPSSTSASYPRSPTDWPRLSGKNFIITTRTCTARGARAGHERVSQPSWYSYWPQWWPVSASSRGPQWGDAPNSVPATRKCSINIISEDQGVQHLIQF